jgi:hypothetical protein
MGDPEVDGTIQAVPFIMPGTAAVSHKSFTWSALSKWNCCVRHKAIWRVEVHLHLFWTATDLPRYPLEEGWSAGRSDAVEKTKKSPSSPPVNPWKPSHCVHWATPCSFTSSRVKWFLLYDLKDYLETPYLHRHKKGNVRINVTLRRVRVTTVAVEDQ